MVMTKAQQAAVRNYLISLRDPSALRDDDAIADLHSKLDQTDDDVERLKLPPTAPRATEPST
jgi:hypothetical protein